MTETALKNKEIRVKQDEIANKAYQARQDRLLQDKMNKRSSDATITAGALKAFGSAAGSMMKNDPAWYLHYNEAGQFDTNLPTYMATGERLAGAGLGDRPVDTLPQIMVMMYHNVFGSILNRNGQTQAHALYTINQASDRLLSILRSYNSRLNSYPASDLFQFMYGEMEIFRFVARACTAVRMYSENNSYHPNLRKALVSAFGFDWTDMSIHISDYRAFLKEAITDLNINFALPADWPLLQRKLYLDTTVLIEGQGDNSQLVIFRPHEYHEYNETNARLEPYIPPTAWTFSAFVNAYGQMYDKLKNVSYFVSAKADLLTAEANGLQLFTMDPSFIDTPIVYTDVKECLDQIMNAMPLLNIAFGVDSLDKGFGKSYTSTPTVDIEAILRTISTNNPNYIYSILRSRTTYLNQDSDGFLIPRHDNRNTTGESFNYDPVITRSSTEGYPDISIPSNDFTKLLNFYHNDVSGPDIMEATRFRWTGGFTVDHVIVDNTYYSKLIVQLKDYSTEILTYIVVDGGYNQPKLVNGLLWPVDVVSGLHSAEVSAIQSINYHPTLWVGTGVSGNTVTGYVPVQQWDKVVPITDGNLALLHSIATKSLLWVAPQIESYNYKGSGPKEVGKGPKFGRRSKGKNKK